MSEFVREERYFVIKRKHLSEDKERALRMHLSDANIGTVGCVVVESDWPEYEAVWKMIEDRVARADGTGDRKAPPCCDSCEFWGGERGGMDVSIGRCRAHPPTLKSRYYRELEDDGICVGEWRWTSFCSWCGEYKQKTP